MIEDGYLASEPSASNDRRSRPILTTGRTVGTPGAHCNVETLRPKPYQVKAFAAEAACQAPNMPSFVGTDNA